MQTTYMAFYGEFNGMCFLLCIVVVRCDAMWWCDHVKVQRFISSVLRSFVPLARLSLVHCNRTNERTIRIVEHFFFIFAIRFHCCCFWAMMSDLYCHWTSLPFSLNHSLNSLWRCLGADGRRHFVEGNLKMCRFDPIMRQSIDFGVFNGHRAKVIERVCASVRACVHMYAKDNTQHTQWNRRGFFLSFV